MRLACRFLLRPPKQEVAIREPVDSIWLRLNPPQQLCQVWQELRALVVSRGIARFNL